MQRQRLLIDKTDPLDEDTQANWHRDKLEEVPELYGCMPPELVAPFHGNLAEIRCHDGSLHVRAHVRTNMHARTHTEMQPRALLSCSISFPLSVFCSLQCPLALRKNFTTS